MEQHVQTFDDFVFEIRTASKQKDWSTRDFIIAFYIYKFGFAKLGVQDESNFYMEYLGADPKGIPLWLQTFSENRLNQTKKQKAVIDMYSSASEDELRSIVDDLLEKTSKKTMRDNYRKASGMIKTKAADKISRKKAKQRERENAMFPESPYSVGDTIKHVKYGAGKVTGFKPNNAIEVDFGNGPIDLAYTKVGRKFFK